MSEIHELFVFALSLVWFAGATPDKKGKSESPPKKLVEIPKKDTKGQIGMECAGSENLGQKGYSQEFVFPRFWRSSGELWEVFGRFFAIERLFRSPGSENLGLAPKVLQRTFGLLCEGSAERVFYYANLSAEPSRKTPKVPHNAGGGGPDPSFEDWL